MILSLKSLIMKSQVPAYIIKYIECKEAGHQSQKVNLICSSPQCIQRPLICSLCAATTHKGHSVKPLKIYLDQLYKRFKLGSNNYSKEIQQLERRKSILLLNLKSCVQRLADEFMKLEEDILNTFEVIKQQIQQNESKRSHFQEFYLSMIKDNYGDPRFEIKNYLFKEEIPNFTQQDIFTSLTGSVTHSINELRKQFINEKIENLPIAIKMEQIGKGGFLRPANITCEGELWTQTSAALNAPNICLLDTEIGLWTGKFRVQIQNLPAGCKLIFGLIKRGQFLNAKHQFKQNLNCIYIDSTGKHKGAQYSHITTLTSGMVIDFFIKKQNFRVTAKNNNAMFNLPDKNYCFFFGMQGLCQIKITYPYNK